MASITFASHPRLGSFVVGAVVGALCSGQAGASWLCLPHLGKMGIVRSGFPCSGFQHVGALVLARAWLRAGGHKDPEAGVGALGCRACPTRCMYVGTWCGLGLAAGAHKRLQARTVRQFIELQQEKGDRSEFVPVLPTRGWLRACAVVCPEERL